MVTRKFASRSVLTAFSVTALAVALMGGRAFGDKISVDVRPGCLSVALGQIRARLDPADPNGLLIEGVVVRDGRGRGIGWALVLGEATGSGTERRALAFSGDVPSRNISARLPRAMAYPRVTLTLQSK